MRKLADISSFESLQGGEASSISVSVHNNLRTAFTVIDDLLFEYARQFERGRFAKPSIEKVKQAGGEGVARMVKEENKLLKLDSDDIRATVIAGCKDLANNLMPRYKRTEWGRTLGWEDFYPYALTATLILLDQERKGA